MPSRSVCRHLTSTCKRPALRFVRLSFEPLERRELLAGVISGVTFQDLNENGVYEPLAGETPLPGRSVYVDLNHNGHFDAAEPSQGSADDGKYEFAGLAAGSYAVRLAESQTYAATSPLQPPATAKVADLIVAHFAADPVRGKLYASISASSPIHPNSVAVIDQATGAITAAVAVGSNPGRLALADNGEVLYVTTDFGKMIRRVDLVSLTAEGSFSPGANRSVSDMLVAPGTTSRLAISWHTNTDEPNVAIFENGLPLPQTIKSRELDFSSDGSLLYGLDSDRFLTAAVTPEGLTLVSQVTGIKAGPNDDFELAQGRIYLSSGRVYGAATGELIGSIPTNFYSSTRIELDAEAGLIYVATQVSPGSKQELKAYDLHSLRLVSAFNFPDIPGDPLQMIRTGRGQLIINLNCEQFVSVNWLPRAFHPDILLADGQTAQLDLGSKPWGEPGSIRGEVFYDVNESRSKSIGEPGIAGRTVYLDGNANGTLDAGERWTLTDASGAYVLDNLPPGSYAVATVEPAGWRTISPSPQEYRIRRLSVAANDVLYDASRAKIYAALGSDVEILGNSVVIIDPASGAIEKSIEVGSQPSQLALSRDGRALYVAFSGVNRVSRIDLNTGLIDLDFSLGSDLSSGPNFVNDFEVLGDGADVLAVLRSDDRVVIYDRGVARGQIVYDSAISSLTSSSTQLYAAWHNRLLKLNVTAAGVSKGTLGPASPLSWDLYYDNGRIISNGRILDPETGQSIGQYPGHPLAADNSAATSYSVNYTGQLEAYDLNTSRLVKSIAEKDLQNAGKLIYAGSNHLAMASRETLFLIDWNPRQPAAIREQIVYVGGGLAVPDVHFASLKLAPGNPPTANPDSYRFTDPAGLTIAAPGVLANDLPTGAAHLTAVLVSGAKYGTVTLHGDGSFTYSPSTSFPGTDSFTYRPFHGEALGDIQQVVISEGAPGAPTALNDTVSLSEDTPRALTAPGVLANDTSETGQPLTAQLVSTATRGQLTLFADGGFEYTPAANFFGKDQFTYRAVDAGGQSRVSTVTLNVTNVPDNPVSTNDAYTTPQNTPLSIAARGILINDKDPDNQPTSAVLETGPAHGSLSLNANGSFTYVPAANYSGPDSFTYRARKLINHWSEIATVSITVTPIADSPSAIADEYATNEDTRLTIPAPGLLANDSDPSGLPLTALIDTPPKRGLWSLSPDGRFLYTPQANFHGIDQFTYRAKNATGYSAPATVTIRVAPVNDAPVVIDDQFGLLQGQQFALSAPGILANDTDVDKDGLTAAWVDGPANGTLSLNADGSFTYVPNEGFSGTDIFRYRTTDGTVESRNVTVKLDVLSPAQIPVAHHDSFSLSEDFVPDGAMFGVLENDWGRFGSWNLKALLEVGPSHGTLSLNANGLFSYEPDRNFSGTDTFTYRATDGVATSDVATVTLAVLPVNDAPVARSDDFSTPEGTALVVAAAGVLSNDNDIDTASLAASVVSGPANGSLVLEPDGSFRYTPQPGFSGLDSFVYGVRDRQFKSGVMYALSESFSGDSTYLYEVNLATGAVELVSTLGLYTGQLEFLPDGRLFAVTHNNLVEIDTATWSVARIDEYSNPSTYGGGLAYNPGDGKLYAVGSSSQYSLITVDPATGSRTVVASLGDWRIGALAFANDGVLYGVDSRQNLPDRLVRINIQTGEVFVVGPLGRNDGGPLEFDPATGTLYMTSGSLLFSINRESGAATPVTPPSGSAYGTIHAISLAIPPAGPQTLATVSIEVIAHRPWHNAAEPCDVTGDEQITPADALAVINFLNASGIGPVAGEPVAGEDASPHFYDVNGDNFVTPLDALRVINYLNAYFDERAEAAPPDEFAARSAVFSNAQELQLLMFPHDLTLTNASGRRIARK